MKGLLVAAQVLEEHVSQAEMPNVSLNLQDIYKGWMKWCLHNQHAERPADGCNVPIKPEPEGGADESPAKYNNTDAEGLHASKTEGVERSNGHDDNGCHSPQPEDKERAQQEQQPEVGIDVQLESRANQTEATPLQANDCSDDEAQESTTGLKDGQETFCAMNVPPPADANVTTEQDEEEVAKMELSDDTAQSEQDNNQTGTPESTDHDKMAAEKPEHVDVAITLNIVDVGKSDVCLAEEAATPKKKKKRKKRTKTAPEEAPETRQEDQAKKTKKGKKRSKEEDEKEEKKEPEVEDVVLPPLEKKRKKRRKEEEEEGEEEGEGQGNKDVQCDEEAAGGDADPQKELQVKGGADPQLSTQKRRRRRGRRARKQTQQQRDASEEDRTPQSSKLDLADKTTTRPQENHSLTSAANDEIEASEEKVEGAREVKSKKKRKKKRSVHEAAIEESRNGENADDSPEVKKKMMEEEEEEEEAAQSHKTPLHGDSLRKKKKKKKKVKSEMQKDQDAELA
ncbi:uncharacterized protein DDB_G0286299 isoform X2 [Syngnathus scovelli]|nr:cilia- and flagella-associated protein 251 isoform X2 [Syngnathus scovelli]XP_049602636.1 cilia- and flagella-associated protein 251 isoform X2 [Syngnathus scovelli]